MRIATSTQYENQIGAIDNLVAEQQQYGNTISTGKQLNVPSDDPNAIAQDLSIRTTIAQQQQTSTNVTNITAKLTTVDGALSTLSSILSSARGIAIQGASGTISASQRQSLADQVDNLLQEAVGLANTQYAGQYVFAGTGGSGKQPVTTAGNPISTVTFNGNLSQQIADLGGGQSTPTGVTLQQAFNYNASDGSPDVFQMLVNLRDTLRNGTVVDRSTDALNKAGTVLSGTSTLGSANFATPITPDSSGNISISIASSQAPNGVTLTFTPGTTINAMVAAINGSGTGVTATFDPKAERLALSSSQPFQVQDVPSPGATNTSNFVSAFKIQSQADLVNDLSGQIGDIDRVTQAALNGRATVGAIIQNLNNTGASLNSQAVNNTKVQSSIEDADIAKVISQFSQTQTALQAAYGTTSRLESKTLFDYLP